MGPLRSLLDVREPHRGLLATEDSLEVLELQETPLLAIEDPLEISQAQ